MDKIKVNLSISADLSDVAYEAARAQLRELAEYPDRLHYLWSLTLVISLWNIDTALSIMTKYRDCMVLVTPDFSQDEWALRCNSFRVSDYSVFEVYSPGA